MGEEEKICEERIEDKAEKEEAVPPEDLSALKAALEEKEAALAQWEDRYLRLYADFDNYRKRLQREMEEAKKEAKADLIKKILPAIDNLERAVAAASEGDKETLLKGIEMVLRDLKEILHREGLSPVASVGHPFDPLIHEAVDREEVDGDKDNIILEEYRRGYTFQGKLLRPAMVKVGVALPRVQEPNHKPDPS
ncbi:MAG TPA: nucleotide exchange factor GrpE [Moorella mulderi]|nr:nucleotide exchange factor GrpE [Moorella mulderi]